MKGLKKMKWKGSFVLLSWTSSSLGTTTIFRRSRHFQRGLAHRAEDLVCGLDEAGRGSVLGPLVIGAALMTRSVEAELKEKGFKDSKKLSPSRREQFYEIILSDKRITWSTAFILPKSIDLQRETSNLNKIQCSTSIQLLKDLLKDSPVKEIYIDSLTEPEEVYGEPFQLAFPQAKVIATHRADDRFCCVSVASILAKVERDRAIRKIEKEIGIEIGSGYSADQKTIHFLQTWFRKNHSFPDFTRISWDTIKQIIKNEKLQA